MRPTERCLESKMAKPIGSAVHCEEEVAEPPSYFHRHSCLRKARWELAPLLPIYEKSAKLCTQHAADRIKRLAQYRGR